MRCGLCDNAPALVRISKAHCASMKSPTLADLPPPPSAKTGWPWTVETPQLPSVRRDGSQWPRISIVTPSYNQGRFIEEAIRSVLLQGYPDLEYVVIDGGSNDESVEIIRKYQPWLSYWVIEKDRGQAHAINKGFARTTGKLGAYLNSDDIYFAGALHYAAESFERLHWDLLIGRSDSAYDSSLRWLRRSWWKHKMALLPRPLIIGSDQYGISQDSTYWNLAKFSKHQFNENLHFCLDVDWYCRIARGAYIALTSKKIGYFRRHSESKTARLQHLARAEIQRIMREQAELGTFEESYARVQSAMLMRIPRMLCRVAVFGSMEFCYRHPS